MCEKTETMTPELREEMRTMVRQEMELWDYQKRTSRSMFHRICQEYQAELSSYDYTVEWTMNATGGPLLVKDQHVVAPKIQAAISALLRVAYQVKSVENLPPDREPEIRAFFGAVLELMAQRKKDVPASAPTPAGTAEPH